MTHDALFKAVLPLEDAVLFGINRFNLTPFARKASFVAQDEDRRYELEIFSTHPNGKFRRWFIVTPARKALQRMRVMLHETPGEPVKEPHLITHESGIMTHDIYVGDGELVEADSIVKAHYRLVFVDNQAIRNTKLNGKPVTFKVSDARLEGLRLGLVGMRVGGKRKIIMPGELAFGTQSKQYPPGAIVVADIGVLAIEDPEEKR